jgi:hypothetical protein
MFLPGLLAREGPKDQLEEDTAPKSPAQTHVGSTVSPLFKPGTKEHLP